MSERELHARLAAAGRPVSLRTITEWRGQGLMPRLATSSRGLNKGKDCYWIEENAFERATLIYDLFRADVERHDVYWLLWLCGLSVPLSKLRRAWLHKAKERHFHRVVNVTADSSALKAYGARGDGKKKIEAVPSCALLEIALAASAALNHASDPEIDALVEILASAGTGVFNALPSGDRHQLVGLVKAIWSSLRTSDLIVGATDDELREAQARTSAALRYFHGTAPGRDRGEPPYFANWPIAEALNFGAPLFFLVLVFLRSGQPGLIRFITRPDANEIIPRKNERTADYSSSPP